MLLILACTLFATLATAESGRMTWYEPDWNPIKNIVACLSGYPPANPRLFAAVSVYSLSDRTAALNSGVCGRCINIQGPAGSVVVTVVDVMMRDNAFYQDLDLSNDAFIAVVGDLGKGIADNVNWWWTTCPGKEEQKAQTNQVAQVAQNYVQPVEAPKAEASAAANYRQAGCIEDSRWNRVLPDLLWPEGGVSVDSCAQKAASLGYPYFGVEYGSECWAGWGYKYAPAPSTGCNYPCKANQWQTCGGWSALNVYTTASYNFAGCFKDDSNNRLVKTQIGKGWMTVEHCAKLASDQGFKYFGVEYAEECFGANEYSYYPEVSGSCWMECTGNKGQKCGGPHAISVYQLW
ncbi:hypothetical protein BDR26DRAFT_852502 [Obelidium mucronatum]|nr:hypothetical protein BDR26DRAFT_852502 [Obelidium mucronatum]